MWDIELRLNLFCKLTKDQLIKHWSQYISKSKQLCNCYLRYASNNETRPPLKCHKAFSLALSLAIGYENVLLWNAFYCRKLHCTHVWNNFLAGFNNCPFIETHCTLYRNIRRARPNFLPLIQQNTARAAENGGYDTVRSLAQPVLDVYGTGPFPRNHSR